MLRRLLSIGLNANTSRKVFIQNSLSHRTGIQLSRNFTRTTTMAANAIATYEEVKELPKHPSKVLIDVRNPDELKEYGVIPTSINIPLPTVEESLKLTPEQFKAKFGRDKPSLDTEVIFHCMKGGRAQKATDTALGLGFKNARNYLGSWTEWAEREGLKK